MRIPNDPITCDFSPWSDLNPGKAPPAKVSLIVAAVVLGAFAAFFGVVHYWR